MIKNISNESNQKNSLLAWGLWLMATLFFAFQMIPRLWLGVVREHLITQLNIGPDIFGYICAFYYVGYAGMQIPLAMILDRWNARWVLSGCVLLLGTSLWMLDIATDWRVAAFARFLTGVSSGAGFLGVSRIIGQWFPTRMYAGILGTSISLGIVGSVFGGIPTLWLIDAYGENTVNKGMILFCLILAGMMALFMRSPSHQEKPEKITLNLLKRLFKTPVIWVLGVVNLLLVGPLEGFADAWAEPFLSQGFLIPTEKSLGLVSLVFIGLISGSPLIPFIGQRLGHYQAILWCGLGIIGSFISLFALAVSGFHSTSPHLIVGGVLFFIGLCCAYQTNLLTLGRESVSPALSNVAVALLNTWNMSGGTVFHTIIGQVLTHQSHKGHGSVMATHYVWALSCIPVAAFIGVLCLMWVYAHKKPTSKRSDVL